MTMIIDILYLLADKRRFDGLKRFFDDASPTLTVGGRLTLRFFGFFVDMDVLVVVFVFSFACEQTD